MIGYCTDALKEAGFEPEGLCPLSGRSASEIKGHFSPTIESKTARQVPCRRAQLDFETTTMRKTRSSRVQNYIKNWSISSSVWNSSQGRFSSRSIARAIQNIQG